jgi:hypothetical protein
MSSRAIKDPRNWHAANNTSSQQSHGLVRQRIHGEVR